MSRMQKCRRIRKKLLVIIIVLTEMLVLSAWLVKNRVEPHLEEVGRLRANVMVSQIVNKALNEQFYLQDGMDSLLVRETDEAGRTELVRANTRAMNLLITEISKELQKQYAERPQDIYTVPLGTLLGDKFLSQTKPSVDIRIIPISVSSIDFETEFVSEGINQTKYKVYIELKSHVKVIAPLVSDTFEVSTTVLIAEAVILGTVPNSYVYVPEEDILDVTQE